MVAAMHYSGKKTHLPWLFPDSSSISSFPAMTLHRAATALKMNQKKKQNKKKAEEAGLINEYAWTFLCSNLNSKIICLRIPNYGCSKHTGNVGCQQHIRNYGIANPVFGLFLSSRSFSEKMSVLVLFPWLECHAMWIQLQKALTH